MIDKSIFKKIRFLIKEYDDLDERLRIEESKIVSDSVAGSSNEYPYTTHSLKIEGIQDSNSLKKYRKMIKNKKTNRKFWIWIKLYRRQWNKTDIEM